MNTLVGAALFPHPPLLISEVGGKECGQVELTERAVQTAAKWLNSLQPETIVVITPHGPVFDDAVCVVDKTTMNGNLAQFGVPEVSLSYEVDIQLVDEVCKQAEKRQVMVGRLNDELAAKISYPIRIDHGAFVPLYFLNKAGFNAKIMHVTIGLLSYEELFDFGQALQTAIAAINRRTAVVASGDLSHRLLGSGPYGFNPSGPLLDKAIVKALSKVDADALFAIDENMIENAGECGLRPIFVLMGAIEGMHARAKILSYKGPFGVGYAVATFDTQSGQAPEGHEQEPLTPVILAKQSLKHYLNNGVFLPLPEKLPTLLQSKAGAFVSIKKYGQLRGCIGTFMPTKQNLAAEIIANAVSAGTEDPRFPAITKQELTSLDISVDVLSAPEGIGEISQLDPLKYGIIVRKGWRSGLLLPDLEGVDTVEEQFDIACQKAGIDPDEQAIELYRFTVTRYHE